MRKINAQTGIFLLGLLLAISCKPGPKPIEYGSDTCYFCRMTIVDRQHGAEIVTDKGKVYKFDAVECMVNSKVEIGEENIALYLCNHYRKPGELIDATGATFLVSESLPSPMGANLTAFRNAGEAEEILKVEGGAIFKWTSLLTYLESVNHVQLY